MPYSWISDRSHLTKTTGTSTVTKPWNDTSLSCFTFTCYSPCLKCQCQTRSSAGVHYASTGCSGGCGIIQVSDFLSCKLPTRQPATVKPPTATVTACLSNFSSSQTVSLWLECWIVKLLQVELRRSSSCAALEVFSHWKAGSAGDCRPWRCSWTQSNWRPSLHPQRRWQRLMIDETTNGPRTKHHHHHQQQHQHHNHNNNHNNNNNSNNNNNNLEPPKLKNSLVFFKGPVLVQFPGKRRFLTEKTGFIQAKPVTQNSKPQFNLFIAGSTFVAVREALGTTPKTNIHLRVLENRPRIQHDPFGKRVWYLSQVAHRLG